MIERIANWVRRAEAWLAKLDGHRLAYAGLALTCAATALGVPKEIVEQSKFVFYLLLFARG